jgi:DNA repair photolyase
LISSRRATFTPYQPKTILNKSKRADHWFWTRYSAYPYIGCQHGCEFCYCREQKYSPYDDPDDFAYVIKVKENAPQLLRRALSRAPVDAVFTGDYQPAERKFGLSRQMLEVCRDLGFPVFILERSALVLRDLDLIQEIHAKARATVAFSIISTPDSPHHSQVRRLERLAMPVEKRFAAMETLAKAGIPTGICFMPILPGLCDDDANLQNVVRWTADHGGQFVLASGLTLSDQQRAYFMRVLTQVAPELVELYQRLYPPGSYSPRGWNWPGIPLRIRELCNAAGIRDRAPRPVIPGEKRARNKRVVEALANQAYTLELKQEPQARIWAYRKAAWAIEDLEQDIGLVYAQMGVKGLTSIPDIGPRLAGEIEALLQPDKGV